MTTDVVKLKRQGELAIYDPGKGLKSIAVAEAAEKHYGRAFRNSKDPFARAQLLKAIDTKIRAQAEYVEWRDSVVVPSRGKGATPPGRKRVSDQKPALPPVDPGKLVAHRWRNHLCIKDDDGRAHPDEAKIARAFQKHAPKCQGTLEEEKTVRGTEGTGENEWYTPPEYLELARAVLGGIDLDPASSDQAQSIIKAAQYFTKADDGLAHEWHGRIWLNPPYAQPLIADFTAKMVAERDAGRVTAAIMLTHNYTDTAWFHEAAGCADAICFTRGRVKFYEPDGEVAAPTQGQAFFYFGPEIAAFIQSFRSIGFVVRPCE